MSCLLVVDIKDNRHSIRITPTTTLGFAFIYLRAQEWDSWKDCCWRPGKWWFVWPSTGKVCHQVGRGLILLIDMKNPIISLAGFILFTGKILHLCTVLSAQRQSAVAPQNRQRWTSVGGSNVLYSWVRTILSLRGQVCNNSKASTAWLSQIT